MALAPQRSSLGPTDLPAGLAVWYEPAAASLEVGSDWYDVVELPEGRRAVVGEVGRGLPAAAVTGQLRSAGGHCCWRTPGPARVLRALDRFSALIPGADCTTVFCAIIDPRSSTVRHSSAGHFRRCWRNRTARSANSTTPCPLRWPSPPIATGPKRPDTRTGRRPPVRAIAQRQAHRRRRASRASPTPRDGDGPRSLHRAHRADPSHHDGRRISRRLPGSRDARTEAGRRAA